ncbi:MAG: mitofilin family membrane protein [Parvibaculum sp.]
MSDPNDKAANEPDDAKPDTQAEYLKPETGDQPRNKARRRKDPPVLDGTAEEVAGEKPASPSEQISREENDGTRGSSAPGVLVATVAGIGGAAVALAIAWSAGLLVPRQDNAADQLSARIEALESGSETGVQTMRSAFDDLERRLDAAEQKAAQAAESPENTAAIQERLEALAAETQQLKAALNDTRGSARGMQERIDEIEESLPPAGVADQVGALDALTKALDLRLAALAPEVESMEARVVALEEKKDDPDAAARAALGLALANLARATEGSGSFTAELDAVAAFLPEEPELARLADVAADGVATRAALEARFPSLAQDIFDAERRAGEDGVWSRFVSNAKSLITVRRTGEISGDTTEAIVARMEERLKIHDLGSAVVEAKTLRGPAAEAASSWLADAEARLQADQLVRDLSARVAERLAKAKG